MDIPDTRTAGRRTIAPRGWPLWQLPVLPRLYVMAVSAAAAVAVVIAAVGLSLHLRDLVLFAILLCCGLGSVEATRRVDYSQGAIVRDLLSVWCLPVAILLPPFYALIVPVPLLALTQLRVHRGIVYRRVFSAAAIGLAYGAASWAFRSLPLAGHSPGAGGHAAWWCLAMAGCDVLAWLINNAFIAVAIKMSDRTVRLREEQFTGEAIYGDYIQWTVAVVVTFVTAISPLLLAFAWPLVQMMRRVMMHKQLVSRTRIDPKTDLFNAVAWEREATAAITDAVRTGASLACALIDIDHFKAVNDNYGHLAGDEVLRAVSRRFKQMMRQGDLVGRFGGEEFVVLLRDVGTGEAYRIVERLRESVASSPVSVEPPGGPEAIAVTVSIGVATLDNASGRTVTDMLAAADSALYAAKRAGRNRTFTVTDTSPPAPLAEAQPNAQAPGDMRAGPPDADSASSSPGISGPLA
jgi:diguanylate cyclase (GGDEF)-like protein